MKKTSTKWLLRLLTLALAVLVAAGCSGGNTGGSKAANAGDNSGNAGADASAPPAGAAEEEPIEISWLSFNFPPEDGTFVQQYLEETFNVRITNVRIDRTNWKDQLNVRLASGELPDLWLLWGIADVSTYASQNLLAELPVDEIRAHLPELAALIDEKDPGAWNNGLIDGKNYGIPITNLDGAYPLLTVYNEEWLQAVGYDEPPQTLEQFEDVLYKFRNDDPDGNGKKDTYGITGKAASNIGDSFVSVFNAFDVQPTYWEEDDTGALVYGMTTDKAREAFKLLNKWFDDGVLDPEFITSDGKKEEFLNSRVGTTNSSWIYYRPSYRETLKTTDSARYFDAVVGPQFAADGYTGKAAAWGLTGNYFGMSVDVDETPGKREKIYEILNATYTDEVVMKKVFFGDEGVHYDLVDGRPVMKEAYADTTTKVSLGMGAYYGLLAGKSLKFEAINNPAEDLAWRAEVTAGMPMQFDKGKFYMPSRTSFPDLTNLEREYFIKLITGEVDLEGGFDEFVERWNKAGGAQLTKEANEIYAQLKGA
ncbi:extracellular solute-binding protein [Paenibacillus sp. IB182496]|uniref:Extracellular solute-binding protein n=1 Tax=Paenibacillus sabuli TaxID=2772509 RepID=A0A927BSS4_9BACL|nr:extracellular solute-binding protein [Paenibacillus sabuli]MBD2845020.1 extracellular solute-binding protein [Paenibacillus sabuli]